MIVNRGPLGPPQIKRVPISDRERLFDSLGPILERNRKAQEARDQEIEDRRSRPWVDPGEYIVDTTVNTPLPDAIPVYRPGYYHTTGHDTATKTDRRPVPPLFALVAAWAAGVTAGFFLGLNW